MQNSNKNSNLQEIDGQEYHRPNMNLLYKKPSEQEFKKLKDPEVIEQYQYKPKKSLYSSMLNSSKQLFYSFRSNYYKARTLKLKESGDCIIINGKRFDYNPKDQTDEIMLKKTVDNIIWFSYRKDWSPPIHGTSLTTDSGWGCMIRCGQMLYFEALRKTLARFEGMKFSDFLKKILILFNDNLSGLHAPYSIQNIVPEAYEAFNIEPGEWFRSTSILMSIERINEKFKPWVAKDLKMITFVESIIYINVLYEKLYLENINEAKNEEENGVETPFDSPEKEEKEVIEETVNLFEEEKKLNECPGYKHIDDEIEGYIRPNLSNYQSRNLKNTISKDDDDEDYIEEDSPEQEQNRINEKLEKIYNLEWNHNILLSIATRIGVNQPEPRFNPFIRELLAMKQCIGILGGQNDKAYYIIGFHGIKNKFYYLDPHYINPAVDPSTMDLSSYLKKTVHEYNYKDMNSSLQISFLIKGNKDFKNFMKNLQKKIQIYGMDNSFVTILETNQFDMMDGGLVEF